MKVIERLAFLQGAALLFTSIALFAAPAHAQQEVAPERFDAQTLLQRDKPAPPKQTAHARSRRGTSNQGAQASAARHGAGVLNNGPEPLPANRNTPESRKGKRKAPVKLRTTAAQATSAK